MSQEAYPLSGPALPGLTSGEAAARLKQYGPNAVAEERPHPWLALLRKFWAPVPWMLEVTIILQLVLGKADEALIIAILLVFNAVLSFIQEGRANNALALLKNRLAVQARTLRDGHWQLMAAQELVPGDVIHLRMGDLSPADIHLLDGQIQLDQSALTGESLPVEAGAGGTAYAGAIVKRGEATGEITATGSHTYFGKTAELVRTAKTVSHLETLIFIIVKYLVALDIVLVAALLIYAGANHIPMAEVIPFALILLVASVPVALPATFTLATAFGALELAKRGVLVTRLSAIEEAAAMDTLASDKTGTITQNRLALAALRAYPPHSEDDLLRLAALACDEATQDPIDLAILDAARARNLLLSVPQRLKFTPFDPAIKRSEALFQQEGGDLRVLKGFPQAVAAQVSGAPDVSAEVEALAAGGYRILAVASGTGGTLQLAGLVALQDPPREDSKSLVQSLHELGVRVLMVTGDGLATARTVAAQVGIGSRACPPESLRGDSDKDMAECDVIAGVLPEDKFRLIQNLQHAGHVTGMTGDGVNDAPALKQAEVGIAVSSATDVAKAAASMVLTNPGLTDVLAAVEVSRRIYQRMLTYTLNKIIKTLEIAVFLSLGLMLTGTFVITPLLMVLLLFTNDFVTMSIATDRVSFSRKPERWRIPTLMLTAGALAVLVLILSFSVFFAGRDLLHLPLPQLQTLIFVMLVFSGQGTVYLVRERHHFWHSLPSRWLMLASLMDILIVSVLATQGILMAAISPALVVGLLILVLIFLTVLDFFKIQLFRHFGLH
ncbi:pirin [Sulfuricella sp. T08]|uniref:plasma-membrane proton-efflux P-type ATPase n=1 Tax=Sulfuricella sp. T08 TaxID=1632857 RepID=UPI0006179F57|nr:plasma-membrane proton-efflux P-type ATPase [Sulfuricella sp. T08]GAO35613.1 pirin [Sulfuricella sp. T08]